MLIDVEFGSTRNLFIYLSYTERKVKHSGEGGFSFEGLKFNMVWNKVIILYPLLFLDVLDWVVREANSEPHGIQRNPENHLEDLDFTATESVYWRKKGYERSCRFEKYAIHVGLKINEDKTKLVKLNSIICHVEVTEEVRKFCYFV